MKFRLNPRSSRRKEAHPFLLSLVILIGSLFVSHAATFTVTMTNNRFNPPNLTINAGDTITWTDTQGQHDTVSGSSGVPSGVWNSTAQFRRLMNPGESFSFTFNNAGTFPYYCTPHWPLGMVGTIRVIAANAPPSVSIASPQNGADFPAPADITIQANASDPEGGVVQVEFFMNGTSLGVVPSPPYNFTVNNLGPGSYTFSAIANDGTSSSAIASVAVTVSGQQPVITEPPQSQTANVGSDVLFTAQATGSAPLAFQWFFGATAIPNATATSLQLTNVSPSDAGAYTVQVSNNFGSASASAILTVTNPPSGTPPSITTQPESQTVSPGTNVTFVAAAIGSSPLAWQWFLNSSAIPGATNSSLVLSNVTAADSGDYFAVATNPFGSATSSHATLTVIVPPVCDFTLSSTTALFPSAGGSNTVSVIAGPDCPWTVIDTNFWILITSGNSGVGPGTINYTVLSNSTRTARSGVLLIAGNAFTVTQSASLFPARADFNHDGHTDFLWQNSDGRVQLWLMDGLTNIGKVALRASQSVPPGSRIVGTHDFNRDRSEDILWQHPSGSLEIWFMNGTNFLRSESILNAPALGRLWQAVAIADFNRDGNPDVLFRHRDGYVLVWYLQRKRFFKQSLLLNGDPVPSSWRVVGVADVDNDRRPDIIWQSPDSSIVVWFMSDIAPLTGPLLSNLPKMNAQIIGLNDLNQDGKLDFIWRDANNQLSVWWMNQTNRLGSFPIIESISPAWKLVAPKH